MRQPKVGDLVVVCPAETYTSLAGDVRPGWRDNPRYGPDHVSVTGRVVDMPNDALGFGFTVDVVWLPPPLGPDKRDTTWTRLYGGGARDPTRIRVHKYACRYATPEEVLRVAVVEACETKSTG